MYKILTFDFETTKAPAVYAWGIYGEDFFKYGISIDTFFDEIKKINKDYLMFAHNGANFDFHYIVPHLKRNGFRQKKFNYNNKEIIPVVRSEYKEKNIAEEWDKNVYPFEYTLLVKENGKIMEIVIGLPSYRNDGSNRILRIRDSNLLFPSSLAGYGKTLNQAYNTTKYTKGSISYDRQELYKSIEEFENNGNELEYLKQDCFILYEYLMLINKTLPIQNWKLTAASTAYHIWQKMYGQILIDKMVETGEVVKLVPKKSDGTFFKYRFIQGRKHYSSVEMGIKLINKLFPCDWMNYENEDDVLVSQDLYKWYGGGLTILNPIYKGIVFNDALTLDIADIKSSYPSSMRDGYFPYGVAYKKDMGKNYMRLYEIITKTDCICQKGMPFVPVRTGQSKLYQKILPKDNVFYLTDIELERFEKNYKGKFSKEVKYSFEKISGEDVFGSYIDKFYKDKEDAKKENDQGKSAIAKLSLNALTGKFGTKTEVISKIYNEETNDFEKDGGVNEAKFYLPIVIWITAYSRMKLVDAVGDYYRYFVYGDTDSIFYLSSAWKKLGLKIGNNLGDWEIEKRQLKGVIRRAKQYLLFSDAIKVYNSKLDLYAVANVKKQYKTGFAGIRYKGKYPPIEDYIYGGIVEEQLRPNKKSGMGVILEDFDKTIKPIWEYTPHPEDWFTNQKEWEKNYEKQWDYIFSML